MIGSFVYFDIWNLVFAFVHRIKWYYFDTKNFANHKYYI